MEKKLLTVSIAAYNVSQYIERALASLVIPEFMDKIEVFIVDDGSTDDIEAKVAPYVEEWKSTFKYIKKKNGGYGSTVNWSVENANGRYFKLLDGDDYYNKEGLRELLRVLENCKESAIVSQAVRVYPNGDKDIIFKFLENIKDNSVLSIENLETYADVAVWGYTFRTDVVREHWSALPENSFYTDRLFVIQALLGVECIRYVKQVVYNYRVGMNEQSTSKMSIRKHYLEAMEIDRKCCILYEQCKMSNYASIDYVKKRLALYYASTICMLLLLPNNKNNFRIIKDYEAEIKKKSEDIYFLAPEMMKRVKLLRKTNYSIYYLWPIIEWIRKLKG